MRITYDGTTDTLTIVLRDVPAHVSDEERSGVILDYDAEDRLIAIEVLDASSRIDDVDTVQLQVVSKSTKHSTAAE
jgi:YD repeat-containing protein